MNAVRVALGGRRQPGLHGQARTLEPAAGKARRLSEGGRGGPIRGPRAPDERLNRNTALHGAIVLTTLLMPRPPGSARSSSGKERSTRRSSCRA